MTARSATRAIECLECGAAFTADGDEVVDILGRHYAEAHHEIALTEDRIRSEIAVWAYDPRAGLSVSSSSAGPAGE